MEIVTPGIRLSGDNIQDQNKNRVVSPKSAFKNGATAIVIGRSITQGSIKKNLQKYHFINYIQHKCISKSIRATCIILNEDKTKRIKFPIKCNRKYIYGFYFK